MYRLRGVCALAACIRSADVIEAHVPESVNLFEAPVSGIY
jgi:hypothetical protein